MRHESPPFPSSRGADSPVETRLGAYADAAAEFRPYDPLAPEAARAVVLAVTACDPRLSVEHIGSTAVPQYPAASAAHQIQLPDEPPLGFDNPELEPPTMPSPVEAQAGGPADAPATPLPVEHAGPSSSYRRLK